MNSVAVIEKIMRERPPEWWERLCEFIPELEALSGTPQPQLFHSEGDVAIHTRLAIQACSADSDPDLLWAVLLHDIGKPETTRELSTGRIIAHGHAQSGAKMAGEILHRLGMEPDRSARIVWVIRHHCFHHSWQLQKGEDITRRQRRFLNEPDFPLLLELLRIDCMASHKPDASDNMQAYGFYKDLFQECVEKTRE